MPETGGTTNLTTTAQRCNAVDRRGGHNFGAVRRQSVVLLMRPFTIMTPGRAAAYIGGAVLLAAWLSSAATSVQNPEPVTAPRAEPTSGTDSLASDVQEQAARLRTRLAAAPIPQQPARNPFTFAAREVPRLRQSVRAAAVPAPGVVAAPVAAEPELSLIGVAEQQAAQGLVRTAMIVGAGDELFLVTEGQEVAARYRVSAVGADAVELRDLSSGAVRRLALR